MGDIPHWVSVTAHGTNPHAGPWSTLGTHPVEPQIGFYPWRSTWTETPWRYEWFLYWFPSNATCHFWFTSRHIPTGIGQAIQSEPHDLLSLSPFDTGTMRADQGGLYPIHVTCRATG